ncbi:MAG TPA: type II toxin-antitoxin system VapC family toxin [Terracidiphilus sp.]|nr:type II toxin-antitoxin system VapC family toxin [Terracidiphilus sp.]HUB50972.1 type II toxin-antitoxin system VapC family toxin [Terracidiphilus sp.]
MILADTSVWIDHFRTPEPSMLTLLGSGQVFMHPMVVAELALGSVRDRNKTLFLLDALRQLRVARLDELRVMIEAHSLYAKGIGLTDAHLLASCLLTPGTLLWTRDSALKNVAQVLGVLANLP